MNTPRTLEITIPDNYTADEVMEHLAKLPERGPQPGQVAYPILCPLGDWENATHWTRHRAAAVEQACREGYVEKDKIEAALDNNCSFILRDHGYNEGYHRAWQRACSVIREAMK